MKANRRAKAREGLERALFTVAYVVETGDMNEPPPGWQPKPVERKGVA